MTGNESQQPDSDAPADQVREITAQFLEALRSGERPDRAEWMARYPDLAPGLEPALERAESEFLAGQSESSATDPDWADVETRDLGPPGGDEPGVGEASVVDASAPTIEATPGDRRAAERALGLRCPHCGHRIQVAISGETQITCRSCGSSFHFDSAIPQGVEEPTPPKHIGRFDILERLGRGGFGVVYKARDPLLSRFVAIKTPRAGYFASAEDEHRFVREARSAARLRHAHIVPIHEIDRSHGVPYIVSEFIEGRTLADLINRQRITFRESAELVVQVAEALEYAHSQRVVHRDVKPSNILLDNGWHAYVADFGLARQDDMEITITVDGQVLGTPAYMSPEQAAGDSSKVDARSDVYSLGIVLYHAICGELPFRGSRRMLAQQVIHDDPRPPRRINELIPRDLETITLKAIAKDVNRRYQSAREFADDLRRWLRGETILARPVGSIERFARWCRRNPLVAALDGAIALLLLLAAIGASIWAWREGSLRSTAIRERDRAEASEQTSQRRLFQLNVRNGVQRMEAGDLFSSLVWFAEAMRVDTTGQLAKENHRLRIGMVLDQCPALLQLWNRPGQVRHAEFSQDGKRILAADSTGSLVVWDAETGQPIAPAMRHDAPLTFACFNPAGTRAVAVEFAKTAHLWNVDTGERVAELAHEGPVTHAVFSPDARWIATASVDGKARVWDAETGRLVTELKQAATKVTQVRFAPDSSRLMVVSQEESASPSALQLWDPATGETVGKVMRHERYVWHVSFNADGTQMASAGEDGTVRLWDGHTGESIGGPLVHDLPVRRVFFTAEGTRLVSVGHGGQIRVWDVATAKLLNAGMRHGAAITNACMSESGDLLATAGVNGRTRVWLWPSAMAVAPPTLQGGPVTSVALGPTNRRLLVASQDGTVRLWDLAGAAGSAITLAHDGPLTTGVYSPEGQRVLTTSRDKTARLWDAGSGNPVGSVMRHEADVLDGTFSPDGNLVATAGADNMVRLWNGKTGAALGTPLAHSEPVTCVVFGPRGDVLVTASQDGTAKVWDAKSFELRFVLHHTDAIRDVAFSPDEKWIATASLDKTARLWDARDGSPIGDPLPHQDAVHRCVFSPNGHLLITGGRDRRATLWDVESGQRHESPLHHVATISRLAFDGSGKLILTSDLLGHLAVWELSALDSPRWTARRKDAAILDASFDKSGTLVAAALGALHDASRQPSSESGVRLWNSGTGNPLAPLLAQRGSSQRVSFHPKGTSLLSAGTDGTARLWPLLRADQPIGDLASLARVLSGRGLDRRMHLEAIDAESLHEEFGKLKHNYPRLFAASSRRVSAWRQLVGQSPRQTANP